jgi:protein involved in polysaccharide export with SLBB domain
MKKSLAEIFGSFFLQLSTIILIGIILIGTGCATSPTPSTVEPPGTEVIPFYSLSDNSVKDETISSTIEPTPSPETISGIILSPPIEEPEFELNHLKDDSDYIISANDVFRVSVLGEEDLSITARVSERGSISFPLLGEVRVSGYTPLQFERRLERLLEKDYLVSPSVNISILEYSTISVLGQVKKPGAYEIKGRMTISQAIALAGGLTQIASPNGTKVIRKTTGGEKVIPVYLNDILKDGNLSGDITLKSGDLVVIPESFF